MSNTELWDSVCKTDTRHTKEVNFGRKITAIDPYRQIQNATKQFGPAGQGWGWTVEQVQFLPTNEVAVLIRLWHGSPSNTVDQWGQAGLYIDKAEKRKDTDCMKKATTDGVTKCLSYLGFNADVFLGLFDDNKYVATLKKEEAQNDTENSFDAKLFEECKTKLDDAITQADFNDAYAFVVEHIRTFPPEQQKELAAIKNTKFEQLGKAAE